MGTSEKENSGFDDLLEHGEEYLKTKQELSKLLALEKGSSIIAKALSSIIVFAFLLLFFVFASVALCWFIAEYSGKTSTGFLAVAGMYLFVAVILYINRRKWLETPFINGFIKNYFESKTHE
ncbi:MAG: phage holin family protein [Bacteroidota bacterium]